MRSDTRLLCIGAAGSVIAALCCFTPVLVVLFAVLGLSRAVGYLDYVLLPALAFFVILTVYAAVRVWRGRRARDERVP